MGTLSRPQLQATDFNRWCLTEHPEWAELKTQWEQAQLGNDSTDATYRRLQTLEAENGSASRFGDLQPRMVPKRPDPSSPLHLVLDRVLLGDCESELLRVPSDSVNLVVNDHRFQSVVVDGLSFPSEVRSPCARGGTLSV